MRRRPNPSPPPAKRKKAKSVVFAEDRNEVRLVENWIVTGLHIHSMPNGHVRWDSYDEIWPVDRWIVPHGRDQLHFPRTKWIRHGPDPALEDQDGDVEMRDLVGVGEQLSAVTMDVLVEGLARLSVG